MRGPHVIVVPYTTVNPYTLAALARTGRTWRLEPVGGDDAAYWRLLARLWASGEDTTVVEHDMVPTVEALDSFDGCDRDWCAAPYPYVRGWVMPGLGCTRFRAPIMARHPDLLDVVARMCDETHPPRHWCRLDAWTRNELVRRGETRCESHPQVAHLMADGNSSAHGCFTG